MILMHFRKKQIIAFLLLIFLSPSSIALPIIADFSQENRPVSEKKDKPEQNDANLSDAKEENASKSKWSIVSFNRTSFFNYYDQLIAAIELEPHLAANPTEKNISGVDNDSDVALQLAEIMSEEFQLLEDFIRQTSNDGSTLSPVVDGNLSPDSSQSKIQYSNYSRDNYNQARLNLNLDASGILGSLQVGKQKSLSQERPVESLTFKDMLKKILLGLMSPITLLVLLLAVVLFFLSSDRN